MKLIKCRSKGDIRIGTQAFLYKAGLCKNEAHHDWPQVCILKVTRKDNSLGLYFAVHARYFARAEWDGTPKWNMTSSMTFYGTFPTIHVAMQKVKKLIKENADFDLNEDFVQDFLKYRRCRK